MAKTTNGMARHAVKRGADGTWNFKLYVAGDSPRSRAALTNLRRLCEQHLRGKYHIEVIDLIVYPHLAKIDQVLAIPTLVRRIPVPVKRVIGDLSNADRAMLSLDIPPPRAGAAD